MTEKEEVRASIVVLRLVKTIIASVEESLYETLDAPGKEKVDFETGKLKEAIKNDD